MAPSPSSLLSSSVSSLSFLVALQLFSRLFTSILNQALFRLASPTVFGTAAIQFELILSTILFLSREGVRNAILRSRTNAKDDDVYVKQLNLTFVPVLLGVPLALATSLVYLTYASEEVRQQPHLTAAVAVYAFAALIELVSEPMHNRAMLELRTDVRVRAEGLGITAKSCTTLLVLYLDTKDGEWALLAFALGQLAYAGIVYMSYGSVFGLPRLRKASGGYFDAGLFSLSVTMTFQSVIKHVLTEGDKLMLTFFSPLQDQGGYAIAANYGSLVARIVFQPLEETLRVFFSRLLSGQTPNGTHQALDALSALLSVQISISLLFIIYGNAYLHVLLPLVLPHRYLATSAPRVLEAWIYYIPVLALNGGLEAFLSSAASTRDLNRQSRWMFLFSVIYVSTAMMLYKLGLGDVSLIYANSVNLSARITYCLFFASRYFVSTFSPRSAFPPVPFIVVSGLTSLVVRTSGSHLGVAETVRHVGKYAVFERNVLVYVGIGAGLGVICVGVWWITAGRKLITLIGKPFKTE